MEEEEEEEESGPQGPEPRVYPFDAQENNPGAIVFPPWLAGRDGS